MRQTRILVLTVLATFLASTVPATAVYTGASSSENTGMLGEKPVAATANITQIKQALVAAARTLSEAKQNYNQVKQEYAQAKSEWIAVKEKFASNERASFLKGQVFLAQGAKELIHYIDVLTQMIEETSAMTDDQKAELTSKLAGYRSTLENDRSALLSANTTDELRAAANTAKEDWSSIRPKVKLVAGELIIAKADAVVAKAEAASIKLDAKIAELKAAGNDTAKLEKISAQVKTKIASAKDNIAKAKDRLAGAESSGNVQGLLTAADQFVKQANRWMLEMQFLLGQAVREVKHTETGQEGPKHMNATVMSKTPMEDNDNETEVD